MARLMSWELDRLTIRLAVGTAVLVIVPLVIGLFLLERYNLDNTIAARRATAELENRMLEVTLRHQMIEQDNRLMMEILHEIGTQPEVRGAMVLDHEGIIRLSSHDKDIGRRISRDSPTCLVCHSKSSETRDRWVLLEEEDQPVLRSVLPITNRPECQGCHGDTRKLNGILILDISLAAVHAQTRRHASQMAVGALLLMFILLTGVRSLVRRLVLIRLARLGRTARSITAGRLDERAEIEGDDIISSLAEDFNNMADSTAILLKEIRERELQLTGVLNSLDDGLIVLDRDFHIVAANRSISRRLGTYPEALRGKHCNDAAGNALPCHDDETCPSAQCLKTGRLQRATYHSPASDGGAGRVQEVYASPVFADDGSVSKVVEVWRDITERVREEERLAEIERLSSLGVLASGLSHEVNTPLATTLLCAETILDRLEDRGSSPVDAGTADAIHDSADIIRLQVLRCRKITDQFLRFARGIPPSLEPIDLGNVVQGVIALAQPTAREAGIDLTFDSADPLPVVTANTEVVQHVVLNVLVNAIESIDGEGGIITVKFLVDSAVRLQIEDNGSGIPPEVQKNMFEPFRTEKPRGTGLGLFLSRKFMKRFGGDVRLVRSVVGKGSCIEITFPLEGPS